MKYQMWLSNAKITSAKFIKNKFINCNEHLNFESTFFLQNLFTQNNLNENLVSG